MRCITYLSGIVHPEIGRLKRDDLGVLLTPHMGNRPEWLHLVCWGGDNGMFKNPQAFTIGNYVKWLRKMSTWRSKCLFVTAPDIVGNAIATWNLAEPIFDIIRHEGYPVALVAQDGFEEITDQIDWNRFDVLFIGGSTKWKLSKHANNSAKKSIDYNKKVHMGRCNSYSRLRLAKDWGCRSGDGTFLCRAPNKNLPRMVAWLDRLQSTPNLFDLTAS
jgi:hypothetical protein